jgi:hypothetical protein
MEESPTHQQEQQQLKSPSQKSLYSDPIVPINRVSIQDAEEGMEIVNLCQMIRSLSKTMTLGRSRVSGVLLHPFTFATAGTSVASKEARPMRVLIQDGRQNQTKESL